MKVALTGHRPKRLGLPENEADDAWEKIEEWIVKQLFKMYEVCYLERENLDTYCGMASGSDFAFGTVAMLVKVYEIIPLRLHCVLPCKDYNSSHALYDDMKNMQTNGLNYPMNFTKDAIMQEINIWLITVTYCWQFGTVRNLVVYGLRFAKLKRLVNRLCIVLKKYWRMNNG